MRSLELMRKEEEEERRENADDLLFLYFYLQFFLYFFCFYFLISNFGENCSVKRKNAATSALQGKQDGCCCLFAAYKHNLHDFSAHCVCHRAALCQFRRK